MKFDRPFNFNAPPEIVQKVSGLELKCKQIGQRHNYTEKSAKEIALEVYGVWESFINHGGTGFFTWFSHFSGIPRGTAHRYLNAARAIKAKLDPDGSEPLHILASKGAAILQGVPASNLDRVLDGEEIQSLIESRKYEGLFSVRVPDSGADAVEHITERIQRLARECGYEVEKPEALLIALETVKEAHDDEIRHVILKEAGAAE